MEINHIGNKIKRLVEKKNIPIQQLAYKTGKSVTAIYDIYKKQDVNTEVLRKISTALGVSITYWFTENLENSKENQNTNVEVNSTENIWIEQLQIKDQQIKFLQQQIEYMKEKTKK